ncbi:uncharacterized protein MELLADRAFT_65732 [Melampsora larici-populina 98AG31]|uniref:Uncharacterized protein n=1 Tax=Melampsora larici-populina (strain 98AG31 / pathotype 3-4-7) TaxID=747676 RepID=F4RWH9_MELLP|nr:uncharacterized protein MELLADRAFT_65732 [Melampsora larici-populina 98AG31]EGG03287.1 hypothetical protein MELLADRAFT_65732 [Melampsora larici-populina 98AG31]
MAQRDFSEIPKRNHRLMRLFLVVCSFFGTGSGISEKSLQGLDDQSTRFWGHQTTLTNNAEGVGTFHFPYLIGSQTFPKPQMDIEHSLWMPSFQPTTQFGGDHNLGLDMIALPDKQAYNGAKLPIADATDEWLSVVQTFLPRKDLLHQSSSSYGIPAKESYHNLLQVPNHLETFEQMKSIEATGVPGYIVGPTQDFGTYASSWPKAGDPQGITMYTPTSLLHAQESVWPNIPHPHYNRPFISNSDTFSVGGQTNANLHSLRYDHPTFEHHQEIQYPNFEGVHNPHFSSNMAIQEPSEPWTGLEDLLELPELAPLIQTRFDHTGFCVLSHLLTDDTLSFAPIAESQIFGDHSHRSGDVPADKINSRINHPSTIPPPITSKKRKCTAYKEPDPKISKPNSQVIPSGIGQSDGIFDDQDGAYLGTFGKGSPLMIENEVTPKPFCNEKSGTQHMDPTEFSELLLEEATLLKPVVQEIKKTRHLSINHIRTSIPFLVVLGKGRVLENMDSIGDMTGFWKLIGEKMLMVTQQFYPSKPTACISVAAWNAEHGLFPMFLDKVLCMQDLFKYLKMGWPFDSKEDTIRFSRTYFERWLTKEIDEFTRKLFSINKSDWSRSTYYQKRDYLSSEQQSLLCLELEFESKFEKWTAITWDILLGWIDVVGPDMKTLFSNHLTFYRFKCIFSRNMLNQAQAQLSSYEEVWNRYTKEVSISPLQYFFSNLDSISCYDQRLT